VSEQDHAVELANKVLDRVNADPDDDLAILARQFLRARENRWAAFDENELVRLQPASHDMLNRDLFDEIEAELKRRRFLEKE
jgi:hypothetical protein